MKILLFYTAAFVMGVALSARADDSTSLKVQNNGDYSINSVKLNCAKTSIINHATEIKPGVTVYIPYDLSKMDSNNCTIAYDVKNGGRIGASFKGNEFVSKGYNCVELQGSLIGKRDKIPHGRKCKK